MNGLDITQEAIGNTFRSKTRTTLTVIAIVIGAFTLTLTSGVGTGINRYIDTTVASIGAADVMTVTKTVDTDTSTGPTVYDPDSSTVESSGFGPPTDVQTLDADDLTQLASVDGVLSADPTLAVSADYVQHDGGTQYEASLGGFVQGMTLDLAAGSQLDYEGSDYEVAIPVSFVEPLGFGSDDDAVGSPLTFGVTDAAGTASTVTATIVAVTNAGIVGGEAVTLNDSLTTALYDTESVGLTDTAKTSYASAVIRFDPDATDDQIAALKADLSDLGYSGTTVEDQLGAFRTVIDSIVIVLNGFAIIALVAAGFGIVNTLLMSVQERTREIGLMKAMGMAGRKVFGLFSVEAIFIGFLGSALGVVLGIVSGTLISDALSAGVLSNLPGLTLVAFDPLSLGVIVVAVMVIAFVAGTLPALRAARQDPIESLRYE